MKKLLIICFVVSLFLLISCSKGKTGSSDQVNNEFRSGGAEKTAAENSPQSISDDRQSSELPESINEQANQPKTVSDFFALLPEKYFTLEGCYPDKDKDCRKAREEYLKNFKEIEDIKNGYFKGGCDGGQSCIEMALFKRPDSTYIVALATFSEMMEENYFLDYKDGSWTDISKTIIPEYSKDKRYEIPRYGTTVKVFSTKLIEKGDDYELREKAGKLYDLEWKDGKFVKR